MEVLLLEASTPTPSPVRSSLSSDIVNEVTDDRGVVAGITARAQTIGVANELSPDWADDPMDGLMGMAYQAVSQMNAPSFFETVSSPSSFLESQLI